jgi:hypothetical protein
MAAKVTAALKKPLNLIHSHWQPFMKKKDEPSSISVKTTAATGDHQSWVPGLRKRGLRTLFRRKLQRPALFRILPLFAGRRLKSS